MGTWTVRGGWETSQVLTGILRFFSLKTEKSKKL